MHPVASSALAALLLTSPQRANSTREIEVEDRIRAAARRRIGAGFPDAFLEPQMEAMPALRNLFTPPPEARRSAYTRTNQDSALGRTAVENQWLDGCLECTAGRVSFCGLLGKVEQR